MFKSNLISFSRIWQLFSFVYLPVMIFSVLNFITHSTFTQTSTKLKGLKFAHLQVDLLFTCFKEIMALNNYFQSLKVWSLLICRSTCLLHVSRKLWPSIIIFNHLRFKFANLQVDLLVTCFKEIMALNNYFQSLRVWSLRICRSTCLLRVTRIWWSS